MTTDARISIERLSAEEMASHLAALGALLHACVHDGASVGFVLPYTQEDAEGYWRDKVLPELKAGGLVCLVARRDGETVGSAQLAYDTMPNQLHRADVRKLLVHPRHRRQGIARALMGELERIAGALGRSLLTLDTRSGDKAEPLYLSLGYRIAGVIPNYCRDPFEERLDSTTIMYKLLDAETGAAMSRAGPGARAACGPGEGGTLPAPG